LLPALTGWNDAATWANIDLYFATDAVGAMHTNRYITGPIGIEY
jgi:hypothetical protein